MPSPDAYPAMLLPRPLATRAAAALGSLWRTAVDATRALWSATRTPDGNALEPESLDGLNEYLLKDIGASSRLAADAAMRTRDALQTRIQAGQY